MTWIDVTVEKPRYLKKVLFHWFCEGGNRNVSMGYLCSEGWDIYLPYHSYKLNKLINVTHWMELPEYPTVVFEESQSHEDHNKIRLQAHRGL